MIFRRFLIISAQLLALLGATDTFAESKAKAPPKGAAGTVQEETFLKAYDAFRAGDAMRLQKIAPTVASDYVLAPYLEYWRLKLTLQDNPGPDVSAFLERQQGSYLAERLRIDWLKELGKRADRPRFEQTLPLLAQDDLEIRCYAWLARLSRGDGSALEEAKAVWLEPRDLPEGCSVVVERLIDASRLSVDDVWQRARVLLQIGSTAPARKALGYLPAGEKVDDSLFNQAATAPKRVLASPPKSLERRATREMVVFAVLRLARTGEPDAAAEFLRGKLGARLPPQDLSYLWGRVAYEGARRLVADAPQWYVLAGDTPLDDEQLAWKVRAALRAGDWAAVRDSVDRMSANARQDPAWVYWYGRALGAEGRGDGARAYFLRISGQPNFYGLLAAEELGAMAGVPEPFYTPAEADVQAARNDPGIGRAIEFYRIDLRSEATREWVFTIRNMDDAQLLAAAELARRAGIFDRVINTADKTARLHNYKYRFLAPYREIFSEQARATGLEEAWVLGLVRQESRFISDAKSSVGARGLMQLMPATARWMAKRIGLHGFDPARVAEVPTNVTLGTGYLKLVLDDLGHPVLASAAYNAGPGRARRWRDVKPLEGAIYAETIPFNETRDYVKKVMANTMYYSQLIGGKLVPLKDRLGRIPARASTDRFNEELP